MELLAKRGKFYSHIGTEILVYHRGIRSPQRPNGGPSDITRLNMLDGGSGEDTSWRLQRLSGTSKGSMGGVTCVCHCDP